MKNSGINESIRYYYVYVLQSEIDEKFYVGYTKNLIKRINEHNKGIVKSTKNRKPLKLIYWEGCLNRQDALKREKYLKTAWGKRYIKNRIKNYLTGQTTMIYTHVINKGGMGVKSPVDDL